MNLNFKKNKLSSLCLISTFFYTVNIGAVTVTNGYFQSAPNDFWPETTFDGIGNTIQQYTALSNPDVFCQTQGDGYRLPALVEFSRQYSGTSPFWVNSPVFPAHWSNYVNGDVSSGNVVAVLSGRNIGGGIIQEWGNLNAYGWGENVDNKLTFWVTEPAHWYYTAGRQTRGRAWMNVTTGAAFNTGDVYYNHVVVGTQYGRSVACVRDLVPTPSTPTPGFSNEES